MWCQKTWIRYTVTAKVIHSCYEKYISIFPCCQLLPTWAKWLNNQLHFWIHWLLSKHEKLKHLEAILLALCIVNRRRLSTESLSSDVRMDWILTLVTWYFLWLHESLEKRHIGLGVIFLASPTLCQLSYRCYRWGKNNLLTRFSKSFEKITDWFCLSNFRLILDWLINDWLSN